MGKGTLFVGRGGRELYFTGRRIPSSSRRQGGRGGEGGAAGGRREELCSLYFEKTTHP